jgi:two-component sensor histidine kinase
MSHNVPSPVLVSVPRRPAFDEPGPDGSLVDADDLSEATRRRSALVAGIRHDIKHSLQTAQMALRAVLDKTEDGKARALIAGIEDALDEIVGHANKGLELLALGLDDIEPTVKPVALDQILIAVEAARKYGAQRAGMTIRSVPTGVIAYTDRRLLQRCIGNLVTNAIRHSGGKKVLIGVRRRSDGCAIEVRDDGKGLPPEVLQSLSHRGGGDQQGRGGLGLWITRSFARLLGGELTASVRDGSGACFVLRLPGPIERMASPPRARRATQVRLDGRLVVVLDDDVDVLAETGILLRRRGATVITAQDQVEFWAEVQQLTSVPDFFLLDFMLGPSGDGKQATSASCLTWLRNRYQDKLRAAIVTANPAHPALREVGDTPIFEKPLTDEALGEIVATLQLVPAVSAG